MGAVKEHLSTDSTESLLIPLSNFIIHLAAGEQLLNNEWPLVMGYISLTLKGHINRSNTLGPTGSSCSGRAGKGSETCILLF